jgi:hypothetical protein
LLGLLNVIGLVSHLVWYRISRFLLK